MQPDEAQAPVAQLADRGVVAVRGEDAARFLQGLLTGNVERLGEGEATAAGLLTPQGKILFETIVVRSGDVLLLDVPAATLGELLKRLAFYKLRAKVELVDHSAEKVVWASWSGAAPPAGLSFADPRAASLGHRTIGALEGNAAAAGLEPYHGHRIACGVPELGQDFGPGEVFPHEALWDQTGAVDFRKGCYVGQEVVSRMEHRGTARSRFVIVAGERELPERGTEVKAGETPLGTMGSHVGRSGLALLRLDRLAESTAPAEAAGVRLAPRKPPFVRIDLAGVGP